MSMPRTRAQRVLPLLDGVRHVWIHDDRIDHRSEAYVLDGPRGVVLIDPLPLSPTALQALGSVTAICVTGAFHQRACWDLRRALGCPVWLPAGAVADEAADRRYDDGARLPGDLLALDRPGPGVPHFALWHPAAGGVLFCGDLLMRGADGPLQFVPDDHQQDPARSRSSVRACLEAGLPLAHVCPAHGAPLLGDGERAMRQALQRDASAPG